MQKEKIAFIINPNSGRKHKRNLADIIRDNLDLNRFDPFFIQTQYPGHATELVKNCIRKGCKAIIAVGGDGTVNEVASALVNTNVSLGIIPCGSGNGLARHLGISMNLRKAANSVNDMYSKYIDACRLNTNWFFCTCGTGFDAEIGHRFSRARKRGIRSYLRIILGQIIHFKAREYVFTIDGRKYKENAFLVTIANAGQYGNNAFIAPKALIDDGLFDVCILRSFPIWKSFSIGIRLFNGSLDASRYYKVIRGKNIDFLFPGEMSVFHYDGEPVIFEVEKIHAGIHPKALKVIVPEQSVLKAAISD